MVADRLGLRHRPDVRCLDRLVSPVVFGAWRSVLLVPPTFERQFTSAQQEAVLAHELGHVLGRDAIWLLVAELLCAMLWWHPAAWRLRGQLACANEEAADEATLCLRDGPGLLAECLLVLSRSMAARMPSASLAVQGPPFRSRLGQRVEQLLKMEGVAPMPTRRWWTLIAAGGVTTAVLVVGSLGMGWSMLQVRPADATMARGWQRSPLGQAWARWTMPREDPMPSIIRVMPAAERADGMARRARLKAAPALAKGIILGRPDSDGRMRLKGITDDGLPVYEELPSQPVREARGKVRSDDAIFRQLGLTVDQSRRLVALQQDLQACVDAVKNEPAPWVHGPEFNRRWRTGLQEILSTDQLQRYYAYWQ